MTIIVRGYLRQQVAFEQQLTAKANELERFVERESMKHAEAMIAGTLDMVELEFPEFPPHDRYFRIGVNPAGMVMPIELH